MNNLTQREQEIYDLRMEGFSNREIAGDLNISPDSVQRHFRRAAKKVEVNESPGIRQRLDIAGVNAAYVSSGWVKDDDGSWYVRFNQEFEEAKETIETIIQEVFKTGLAKRVHGKETLKDTDDDLLTKYVLADLHFGMFAWAEESGEDYDLKIAEETLISTLDHLIESTPNSGKAIVLNLGDIFHANDQKGLTPLSHNILDMDTRFPKIAVTVIRALRYVLERLAEKHGEVIYAAVPGNHDPDQSQWLTLALMEAYRDHPVIKVDWSPSFWFKYRFGKNLFVAHHGDRVNFNRLYMAMTENFAEDWGKTYWRFLDTGHVHHQKEQELGGALVRSYRTLAPKDAHSAKSAYTAKRSICAQTYHKTRGEILVNNVHLYGGKIPS